MSEPHAGTTPDDVPAWIADLVPVADLARAQLLRTVPIAGVLAVVVAVIPPASAALAALVVALHALAGAVVVGRLAVPGAAGAGAADPDTAGPGAGAGAAGASGRGSLPPGARTLAGLLVLDIVGTGTGLVTLAATALRGVDGGLVIAALAAGALIAVGAVGVLLGEWRPPSPSRVRAGSVLAAALVASACGGVMLGGGRGAGAWALAVGLAVVADAAGLLALRAGRRRDRSA